MGAGIGSSPGPTSVHRAARRLPCIAAEACPRGAAPLLVTGALLICLLSHPAVAGTTVFFNSNQVATLVATGTTWDTISSHGYLFTYTRDKLFTGGIGLTNPIGRYVRVPWPQGVEAQAVTAGPVPGNAQITISRVDGLVFSLPAFTFKLLANTAGAGGTLEIMPQLNGEDALNDPVFFDATGIAGNQFSYDTSPNHLGSTAGLTNYEAYKIGLYVDYALTALTLDAVTPNYSPTDIALSNASVFENELLGTTVGTFTTTDPDAGDTFTYAMVGGVGDTANGLFSIGGNDLLTEASFNYEVQSNYSIRVESVDQGGLSTQRAFSIQILDMDEPPPAFTESPMLANGGVIVRWDSIANHSYTILVSTDLLSGFTVLESNMPSTPAINSYTDSAPIAVEVDRFWKITTEP